MTKSVVFIRLEVDEPDQLEAIAAVKRWRSD